jgi:hypothetical protein
MYWLDWLDLYRVEDVLFLHTFNAVGDVEEFREDGKDELGRLIPFPGPGICYIICTS